MSVKVKICGITNVPDALAAVESGADVVGFVFHPPSPRHISLRTAAEIIREVPPFVVRAGVFVDADEDMVVRAIGECGLNLLQFHGDEPPDYCLQFGIMSMKAFRVRDAASLNALSGYRTDAWLLDAFTPDLVGGTGETFNWDLAVQAGKLGRPIFLAGGLTPGNVAEAIRKVQPYAVDVSSGVEMAPEKRITRRCRLSSRLPKWQPAREGRTNSSGQRGRISTMPPPLAARMPPEPAGRMPAPRCARFQPRKLSGPACGFSGASQPRVLLHFPAGFGGSTKRCFVAGRRLLPTFYPCRFRVL